MEAVILGRAELDPRTQAAAPENGFSGLRFAPPENDVGERSRAGARS